MGKAQYCQQLHAEGTFTESISCSTDLEISAIPKHISNKMQSENRALLGHYAASSCNLLPTFRDNISV